MVFFCRALAALLGLALLVALAVGGLGVAIFSLGGDGDLSLPGLARLLDLPAAADASDEFLSRLEAESGIDAVAAVAGAGAIALSILVLVGAFVPTRERLLTLSREPEGLLATRRRSAIQVAEALAEQPRDASAAKASVRPRRTRPGGRLRVRVDRAESADGDQLVKNVSERLEGFASAASLQVSVRDRVPRRGGRVR